MYPFEGLNYVVYEWPKDIVYLDRRAVLENTLSDSIYFSFYYLDEDDEYRRIDVPRELRGSEVGSIKIPSRDRSRIVLVVASDKDKLGKRLSREEFDDLTSKDLAGSGDLNISVKGSDGVLQELLDINTEQLDRLKKIEEQIGEDSQIREKANKEYEARKARGEEESAEAEKE